MKKLNLVILLIVVFNTNSFFAQNSTSNESIQSNSTTSKTSRYLYFPNLQAYFDTKKMVYYFKLDNKWKIAAELPPNYGGYSLYNKAKVVITDYDGENPQQFIDIHKKLYPYNSKGRYTNSSSATY